MNSVPNNDSEQCIESKLGWVHTQRTLAARPLRGHNAQAACTESCRGAPRPYRGPLPGRVTSAPCCVAARTQALAQRVAASLLAIQKLYRDIEHLLHAPRARCRACRSAPAPCRRALLRRIAALLRCIVTQRSPLHHDTEFVSRLTPNDKASLLSRYKRLYRNIPQGQAALLSRYN